MSSLTKEQLERIEANRLRALEKKAEKLKGGAQASSTSETSQRKFPSSNSQFSQPPPTSSTFYNSQQTKPTPAQPWTGAKSSNSFSNSQHSKPSQNKPWIGDKLSKPYSSQKTNSSSAANQSVFPVFHNVVTGHCRLVSAERFMVDVGYHQAMINMFKEIKSALYDPKEKRWTFLMEDYKAVMSVLQKLKGEASISPLPKTILEAFSKPAKKPDAASLDLSRIDFALLDSLMPFQRDGILFGISKCGRCLIADDMGLGKTIQALGIAHYYKDDWPLLIVCPSSLRFVWSEAIQTWLPSVPFHCVAVMTSSKDPVEDDTKVLITSYDLLRRTGKSIGLDFGVVILDESHFIKSRDSARTKAAMAICQKTRRVLLLSGTPALSRPIELFTQLRIIDSKAFREGGVQEYGLRYCAGKQTPWGWDYSGSSNMQELQLLLERRFMIRRLKSEVIAQLPEKMRQVVILNPSSVKSGTKQMKHFEKELNSGLKKTSAEKRGALLTYFQLSGEAKLEAIRDYVSDLLEGNKKFLCFAHHHVVMDGISELIEKKKIDYIRIDGYTLSSQRKQLCDRFQFNDSCMVAVLSITAANTGITLTAAQLVVFAELFWNPGVLTQAEDRAHRIGQMDSVLVQYLVAQDTADDHLWPLIQQKLDVLNKAGLSKDNFRRSGTTTVAQKKQKTLFNYFSDMSDELDDELLLQAMDSIDGAT